MKPIRHAAVKNMRIIVVNLKLNTPLGVETAVGQTPTISRARGLRSTTMVARSEEKSGSTPSACRDDDWGVLNTRQGYTMSRIEETAWREWEEENPEEIPINPNTRGAPRVWDPPEEVKESQKDDRDRRKLGNKHLPRSSRGRTVHGVTKPRVHRSRGAHHHAGERIGEASNPGPGQEVARKKEYAKRNQKPPQRVKPGTKVHGTVKDRRPIPEAMLPDATPLQVREGKSVKTFHACSGVACTHHHHRVDGKLTAGGELRRQRKLAAKAEAASKTLEKKSTYVACVCSTVCECNAKERAAGRAEYDHHYHTDTTVVHCEGHDHWPVAERIGEIVPHSHPCTECSQVFEHTHIIRTQAESEAYPQLCSACTLTPAVEDKPSEFLLALKRGIEERRVDSIPDIPMAPACQSKPTSTSLSPAPAEAFRKAKGRGCWIRNRLLNPDAKPFFVAPIDDNPFDLLCEESADDLRGEDSAEESSLEESEEDKEQYRVLERRPTLLGPHPLDNTTTTTDHTIVSVSPTILEEALAARGSVVLEEVEVDERIISPSDASSLPSSGTPIEADMSDLEESSSEEVSVLGPNPYSEHLVDRRFHKPSVKPLRKVPPTAPISLSKRVKNAISPLLFVPTMWTDGQVINSDGTTTVLPPLQTLDPTAFTPPSLPLETEDNIQYKICQTSKRALYITSAHKTVRRRWFDFSTGKWQRKICRDTEMLNRLSIGASIRLWWNGSASPFSVNTRTLLIDATYSALQESECLYERFTKGSEELNKATKVVQNLLQGTTYNAIQVVCVYDAVVNYLWQHKDVTRAKVVTVDLVQHQTFFQQCVTAMEGHPQKHLFTPTKLEDSIAYYQQQRQLQCLVRARRELARPTVISHEMTLNARTSVPSEARKQGI
jgi:hypothetical protein